MFRHANWAASLLAGAVLTGACGGGNERAAETQAPTTDQTARSGATDERARSGDGDAITVRGCVTGTGGRYALTVVPETVGSVAARAAAGDERDTHTYSLVGGTDLQAHVGRQVEVTGTVAGRGREVEVDQKEKSEQPAGTTGTGERVTPTVESKTEIEVQARQLTVQSVRPLDQPCAATGR